LYGITSLACCPVVHLELKTKLLFESGFKDGLWKCFKDNSEVYNLNYCMLSRFHLNNYIKLKIKVLGCNLSINYFWTIWDISSNFQKPSLCKLSTFFFIINLIIYYHFIIRYFKDVILILPRPFFPSVPNYGYLVVERFNKFCV